jgi:hypothetical protein|tara:strand:+ start:1980 stop:2531 length:552 start_codon:yes stop_codon:yes gene_type:complete
MTLTFKLTQPEARVNLKAKKTMSGDIMIYDHPDFDVVLSPSGQKVFAMAKEQYGSHVYASQSRLFDYLTKHGVVDPSSVHSGNVFGSLEAMLVEVEEKQKNDVDAVQVALYSVAKFFEGERGHYAEIDKFEDELDKEWTDPSEKESTELGHIPHEPRKGTNHRYPGSTAAWGLVGYYLEESKK